VGGRVSLEDALARVRTGDRSALRDALAGTTGFVIAAAVKHLAPGDELTGMLAGAFGRLCEDGIKRDPGCRGKVAIARALLELGQWEDDVFARGVSLVQREPAFGGPVDTAAELRGVCGIAHARFVRGDALDVLAKLLADPERMARCAAGQGLGDAGRPDASALLRFKLLTGDEAAEVIGACAESLLAVQPDDAVGFLTGLLAPDERGEAIVLAFGASRCAAALPAIVAWCEAAMPADRGRVGYLALALLRLDAATDYLLAAIRDGSATDAIAAGRALATFKEDATVRDRLLVAVADREASVRAEIERLV
jgi:hypothetical protein